MKKTLCALIFGISSIFGCKDNTMETEQHKAAIYGKERRLYIPNECKEVKSMSIEYVHDINLTCLNDAGETIYYYMDSGDNKWTKYTHY